MLSTIWFILGMVIGRLAYLIYHEIRDYYIDKKTREILPILVEAWIRADKER